MAKINKTWHGAAATKKRIRAGAVRGSWRGPVGAGIIAVIGAINSSNSPPPQSEKTAPGKLSPPAVGEEISEKYFRQVTHDALSPCMRAIEKSAQYDLRWTGWLSIADFNSWNKYQRADGTITMRGDNAEPQNGFGNWVRVSFSCTFDPATETAVSATLNAGRLRQ